MTSRRLRDLAECQRITAHLRRSVATVRDREMCDRLAAILAELHNQEVTR